MAKNDYPVPSYLADVFSNLDGRIETPEAGAVAEPGYRSVYVIDCEIQRFRKVLSRVVF
jgi:hypothetical protein